jgi:hypothetical protein
MIYFALGIALAHFSLQGTYAFLIWRSRGLAMAPDHEDANGHGKESSQ